ncbi:hypothetical protein Tco_1254431 [Tanacetum coccineum]
MSNFMASQDAKISRFEADFKQYQSEMTNKLDTFLKAFNDQMTGALPSDTIGLLEETEDFLRLADGTKSYPIGIVKNVEVNVGKLKLFEDFHVVDMERETTCPLLIGGFLATANVVTYCKKIKIAVGEGLTRSIFRVRELDFVIVSDDEEIIAKAFFRSLMTRKRWKHDSSSTIHLGGFQGPHSSSCLGQHLNFKGNSQVKYNKIDLLVQQYEQFTILEEESIDSGFARFNTIITSLKALDKGFSSKNYVRKFLRALHPKWRANVTTIEESKDLSSLALDELIVISPAYVEANFQMLESLMKDYRSQAQDEGLQRELEYYSKDYDEDIKAELRPLSNGQARLALRIGSPVIRMANRRTVAFEGITKRAPNEIGRTTGERRWEVSNGRTTFHGLWLDICPSSYILIFLVLRVYMLLGFRPAVSPKVPFVYKVCRNCEFGLAILSEGEGDSLNFFIGDLPPLLPHKMRTMDN